METQSEVEQEIGSHRANLVTWSKAVKDMACAETQQGRLDRFVQDCSNTISYLDACQKPSSADLTDFVDRCNSLEIQYHNIMEDLRDSEDA